MNISDSLREPTIEELQQEVKMLEYGEHEYPKYKASASIRGYILHLKRLILFKQMGIAE